MTTDHLEASRDRSASEVFAILEAAADGRTVPAKDRPVVVTAPSTPAEGLALLAAYTSILDPAVRQAILDLVALLAV